MILGENKNIVDLDVFLIKVQDLVLDLVFKVVNIMRLKIDWNRVESR